MSQRTTKTYNKYGLISKYSDQPVNQSTQFGKGLVYPYLNRLEAVEGTCDQRKLRSDCADAQADLSLLWLHKFYCGFCRALAQIYE